MNFDEKIIVSIIIFLICVFSLVAIYELYFKKLEAPTTTTTTLQITNDELPPPPPQ